MFQNVVTAIRIYLSETFTPMADILMSDGAIEHIRWTDVKSRLKFEDLITGYTLFYDERPKRDWSDWPAIISDHSKL